MKANISLSAWQANLPHEENAVSHHDNQVERALRYVAELLKCKRHLLVFNRSIANCCAQLRPGETESIDGEVGGLALQLRLRKRRKRVEFTLTKPKGTTMSPDIKLERWRRLPVNWPELGPDDTCSNCDNEPVGDRCEAEYLSFESIGDSTTMTAVPSRELLYRLMRIEQAGGVWIAKIHTPK